MLDRRFAKRVLLGKSDKSLSLRTPRYVDERIILKLVFKKWVSEHGLHCCGTEFEKVNAALNLQVQQLQGIS
jgi:hypothetical protein